MNSQNDIMGGNTAATYMNWGKNLTYPNLLNYVHCISNDKELAYCCDRIQ